jgi:hypothetical protein
MPMTANPPRRRTARTAPTEPHWAALIPADQWDVLVAGTDALREAEVKFLLGGALALATYTGRWRSTKDIDTVIRPADRMRATEALQRAGFADYFSHEAYDRSWIFRGYKNDVLFDVIWDLPNHRVPIDAAWFERAPALSLRGRSHVVVPAEELVRVKLYVMQRERCDWVDVLNVLAGCAAKIDWEWLVRRMDRDLPLLQAALAVFSWMCPGRAQAVPAWLRQRLALPASVTKDAAAIEERRVRLFDSRPWFAAHHPADQPLQR